MDIPRYEFEETGELCPCGQLGCLCDVVVLEPVEILYGPTDITFGTLAARIEEVGMPWDGEQLHRWAGRLLGLYEAAQGPPELLEALDMLREADDIPRDRNYRNSVAAARQAAALKLLSYYKDTRRVAAVMQLSVTEVARTYMGADGSGVAALPEAAIIRLETILVDGATDFGEVADEVGFGCSEWVVRRHAERLGLREPRKLLLIGHVRETFDDCTRRGLSLRKTAAEIERIHGLAFDPSYLGKVRRRERQLGVASDAAVETIGA